MTQNKTYTAESPIMPGWWFMWAEWQTLRGRNGIYHYEIEFAGMKKTIGKLSVLK